MEELPLCPMIKQRGLGKALREKDKAQKGQRKGVENLKAESKEDSGSDVGLLRR